jgi:hypothetical protein
MVQAGTNDVEHAFVAFLAKYGKTYASKLEHASRFETF